MEDKTFDIVTEIQSITQWLLVNKRTLKVVHIE